MQLKAKDKEEEKKIKQCRGEVAAGVLITFNQTTSLTGEPFVKLELKTLNQNIKTRLASISKKAKTRFLGHVDNFVADF